MKKTFCIFLLGIFMSLTNFSSAQIQFETKTWEEVKKIAKAQKKLIFVDVYTDWCPPCRAMDEFTFQDEEVGKYFKQNFIAFKLNPEKTASAMSFDIRYNVKGYPSYLFINPEGNKGAGEIYQQFEGLKSVDVFLQKVSEIANAYYGKAILVANSSSTKVVVSSKKNAKWLYFDANSAAMPEKAFKNLDLLADILAKNKSNKIVLVGNTTEGETQNLAKVRVQSAKNYLISKGINTNRISVEYKTVKMPVENEELKGNVEWKITAATMEKQAWDEAKYFE